MITLIRESEYFIFDGIQSSFFNILNVNVSSGLLEEPFHGNRKIIKERIRGNPRSYIIDYEDEPLTLSVNFAFEDYYDEDKIREVARWLLVKKIAPLQFSANLDRVFYGSFVGDYTLVHNGLKQGYLSLTFECNSPYAYTPVQETPMLNYSNNAPEGSQYTLFNVGDDSSKPIITVQIVSGNSFSITNNSNSGQKIEFTGLEVDEELIIDCEAEDIVSNIPATFRYNNMTENSEFLELVIGNNFLNIKGNIRLHLQWQSPLFQG